jgi:hypothetical protein
MLRASVLRLPVVVRIRILGGWSLGLGHALQVDPRAVPGGPLLSYIDDILSNRQPNETITIIVPHFVAGKRIYNALHMQTAEMLRRELLSTPGVVITEVPYQVE